MAKLRTGADRHGEVPPPPPPPPQLDIEMRDASGRTALMQAAQAGQLSRVQALLAAGAQVDARDARNWCALMIAAHEGRSCVVLALAQAHAELAAQRDGCSAALQPMRRRSRALI
ncbi:ankyrin repeat domain-containing protein [Acidovorax sp. CCYZU-2555]|uniref:ankyrin repeat domain-containing protein n=1 Tax=Acidovorax sp. CCYZU-2555 TaxID=2835042 RepID=UPI001BCCC53E|nr:ankyrin repeat domain-containing protein [Acidovorax sp. CCYZU-2555]MBS7781083.1 ankyrin repeat domain-containing protein [Acidovorax sp. CCYZU-2555]